MTGASGRGVRGSAAMSSDHWRSTYDVWKQRLPDDSDERAEGCTCWRMTMRTRRDPWCPVHGRDPDDGRDANFC